MVYGLSGRDCFYSWVLHDIERRYIKELEEKMNLANLISNNLGIPAQESHCVSGESANNASTVAIKKAQDTFSEAATDMGLFGEDDVQSLVNETRCYYGEC